MGIFIELEIIPSMIEANLWSEVYKESLELLNAYPFGDIFIDELYGMKRFFMDRATEYDVPNYKGLKKWSVKGDLNTLATAGRFSLYNSSNYYSSNNNYSLNDILESFIDQNKRCSVMVFDNKTQGEAYHIYVLAIAALIESRFPKAALVGGNIPKEQCEIAVDWANTILENKIDIPVRVDYKKLIRRLKKIVSGENLLENFMNLKIGEEDSKLRVFLEENFEDEEIKDIIPQCYDNYRTIGKINRELNNINHSDMLIFYDDDIEIDDYVNEEINSAITELKNIENSDEFKNIVNKLNNKEDYIKEIIRLIVEINLLTSKSFWDRLENEYNEENYNFIIAVLMLKNDWHTRSIQKAILENQKFMDHILQSKTRSVIDEIMLEDNETLEELTK